MLTPERFELARSYGARMEHRLARATPEAPPAPPAVLMVGGKTTSAEMASLAGKLMDHPDPDVRRLAASVLVQFEKANSK